MGKETKYPDFLELAFSKGYSTINRYKKKCKYYTVEIGLINIIEGQIIACDAFVYNDEKPFSEKFPIGKFPVELAIECLQQDERIGFARIKFTEKKPLNWKYALVDGQILENLSADEYFGYPVDSATGSFMDTSGMLEYEKKHEEDHDYFNQIIELMEANYKHTRDWLMWESNGKNVAMFTSGLGDGLYATYIGYDENDNICRLLTDFRLIDWPQ